MVDFLNTSLFEMLLNADFINNLEPAIYIKLLLCVIRTLMIWPLMHFFYNIAYSIAYHVDRNKNNSLNLRSSRIKRKCYEDFWREYWEYKDVVHSLSPSLESECKECKECSKGDARCINIRRIERHTQSLFKTLVYGGIILAILLCNPLVVLRILGPLLGTIALALSLLLTYPVIISTYRNFDSQKVFFKKKHDNPYANIYFELCDDGSYARYYEALPESSKGGSPNAVPDYVPRNISHTGNGHREWSRDEELRGIKRAIENQGGWRY